MPRDPERGGNSMDTRTEGMSAGLLGDESGTGVRNTNAASCQFYGSLWWVVLATFGRSVGQEGTAATDSADSNRP